jgi:hypothetical protein
MIFAIDHFVLSASGEQAPVLLAQLLEVGFVANNFVLSFEDHNVESEILSYDGGGMVEVLHSGDARSSAPNWFAEVPRVIGIGFASDDFVVDTDWGEDQEEGHWTMEEELILPDGSPLQIVAAGPHRHVSEFYVFVMDRPARKLQFSDVPSAPHLTKVVIRGREAVAWRERLRRWLGQPEGTGLQIGDVELHFQDSDQPGVRASPVFAVPTGPGHIALDGSSIELTAIDPGRS